ncbi:FKBP-type peptidyl-prolyl cis-trans isomerase [Alistipes sp. OttesenSCG-928-L06]|nr:FKBP-type peptidyl-prolyl cis-trans isomerase [Alistipes sp. OttesenSCG-928-L06]
MKKWIIGILLLGTATGAAWAQRPIKLQNEADSVSYSLGFLAGNRILENYPGVEKSIIPETFQYAFQATIDGEMPFVDEYKTRNFVDEYYTRIKKQIWRENRLAGERFLEQNSAKRGVTVTSSGLQYEVVRAGNDDSQRPRPYDDMVISYVGKTLDGNVFDEDDRDSTYPASLNDGLEEGTQFMSPGAKYIFYLPHTLAFGEDGRTRVNPYSTVIYEVEMISMTRDHNYYDEDEDDDIKISATEWNEDEEADEEAVRSWDAGDYTATTLSNANLRLSGEGYRSSDIVKSYEVEGFRILVTEDHTIVLDRSGSEVFRGTLDEEDNSYDSYFLTEFRHKNGEGPLFLLLDIGFDSGNYYGCMVYTIQNGRFAQAPEFINLVTFNPEDSDEQNGRISPTVDMQRAGGQTTFYFDVPTLCYNPAGVEIIIPGEFFQYLYDGEKLTEAGVVTQLSQFQVRELTKQFQQEHDFRIWHAEKGDVDGDGQPELVVFVYENETIYVCELDGDKVGRITGHDLSYEYSIDRNSRVLRGNMITVERDDDSVKKHLVVHNGNLVEK